MSVYQWGSCLNAPRITDVRTFHCGEFPRTLAALLRIKKKIYEEEIKDKQDNNNPQTAAQRAGPLALISDDFL